MITLRWKLYGLLVLAFVLGLLGVRAHWIARGEEKLRGQIAERRLEAIKTAAEVRRDVEVEDDVNLAARAREWVRGDHR